MLELKPVVSRTESRKLPRYGTGMPVKHPGYVNHLFHAAWNDPLGWGIRSSMNLRNRKEGGSWEA